MRHFDCERPRRPRRPLPVLMACLALTSGCLPFEGICDTAEDCPSGQVCGPEGLCLDPMAGDGGVHGGDGGVDGGVEDGGGGGPAVTDLHVSPERASLQPGHDTLSIQVSLDSPGVPDVRIGDRAADCGHAGLQQSWSCSFAVEAADGEGLHTVSVTAQDDAGHTGPPTTTPVTFDFTGPSVTGAVPGPNAAGVFRDAGVSVTFSEPVDEASSAGAFSLVSEQQATVPGNASLTADGTSLTFEPDGLLEANMKYTALVKDLVDRVGNPMTDAFAWNFTTGAEPPVVVAVTPADGTRPYLSRRLTATFSLPMDAGSAPSDFFSVSCGVDLVSGTSSWSTDGRVATFLMDKLVPGPCTAKIQPGIKDQAAGAELRDEHLWSFDTRFETRSVATGIVSDPGGDGHVALDLDPAGGTYVAFLERDVGGAVYLRLLRPGPSGLVSDIVTMPTGVSAPQSLGHRALRVDATGAGHLFFAVDGGLFTYDSDTGSVTPVPLDPPPVAVRHVSALIDPQATPVPMAVFAAFDGQQTSVQVATGGGGWTVKSLGQAPVAADLTDLVAVRAPGGTVHAFESHSAGAWYLQGAAGAVQEVELALGSATLGDVASDDQTHRVVYVDAVTGAIVAASLEGSPLKLGTRDTVFSSQDLKGDPVRPCAALDAEGHLHVAWLEPDPFGPYLAYANDVDGSWLFTKVDTDGAVVGRSCSMALRDGTPVIAYTVEAQKPTENEIRIAD